MPTWLTEVCHVCGGGFGGLLVILVLMPVLVVMLVVAASILLMGILSSAGLGLAALTTLTVG